MLNLFLTAVISFFAIYGITLFVFKILDFTENPDGELIPAYSVIAVKNKEETIEGTIRSIAWQMQALTQNNSALPKELIVLDLGSEDRTFLILEKLSEEYPFIHPLHKSDYISFIKKI